MRITQANLDTLRVGFKTTFQGKLNEAPSEYQHIATVVPSSQKEEKYGWLGKFPNIREWIGERVVQNLMEHDYSIKEKKWEQTLGVDRDDIETDSLGIYKPMFEEMGNSAGSFKDQLTFQLFKDGFNQACYDGQNFFDTDHPVLDENGQMITVANTDGGTGQPWFLLDDTRALKPIILQIRKDFQFVAKDQLSDDNVFNNNEFIYGADARMNAGFGFWQFTWGSKQALNVANYQAARVALQEMKGDYGRPLGLRPRKLIVPPSLEGAALKIVNNEFAPNGETNEWKGTAEVVVASWLA